METLKQALHIAGMHEQSLAYHLNENNIQEWEDCTKVNLYAFKDYLLDNVSPNSAATYMTAFRKVLKVYEDVAPICEDYKNILKGKSEKPLKVYLTIDELKKLEKVKTRNRREGVVLTTFLLTAYTGCRLSDATELDVSNISNGYITYVSKKTSICSTIPCTPKIREMVVWLWDNRMEIPCHSYNRIIRRLCQKAGITDMVTIYHAGKNIQQEKWKCVSSHTGRISFATNLFKLHTPILDISKLMGHSGVGMTERYIVPTQVELSKEAMKYFQG